MDYRAGPLEEGARNGHELLYRRMNPEDDSSLRIDADIKEGHFQQKLLRGLPGRFFV